MGIIIGQITYVRCDKPDCKNRSFGNRDQSKAREDAEKGGWFISEITGFSICPECRR